MNQVPMPWAQAWRPYLPDLCPCTRLWTRSILLLPGPGWCPEATNLWERTLSPSSSDHWEQEEGADPALRAKCQHCMSTTQPKSPLFSRLRLPSWNLTMGAPGPEGGCGEVCNYSMRTLHLRQPLRGGRCTWPGQGCTPQSRIQDAILWEEASTWHGDWRHTEMVKPSRIPGDTARA